MCRNIRTLHNFKPAASDDEIRDAALQYVRKLSGTRKPSKANREIFERAIDEITEAMTRLVRGLVTTAAPRNREEELRKAREKFARRQAATG